MSLHSYSRAWLHAVWGTLERRPLLYGIFSVSHSAVEEVSRYIAKQEEHHRRRSYSEELRLFVERYGLKWHPEDETVENGFNCCGPRDHPAQAG